MSDVITVGLRDNVNLEIACEIDQAFELKEFFSCYATNYKFNPKFKAKMWNGKISFFNIHDKTLPIGLLAYLKPFLKKFKYRIRFEFDRTKMKNDITTEDLTSFHNVLFDGVTNNGKPVYPRDYQHDAILSALQHKRGIIESCTGSGKSLNLYSLTRFIMDDVNGKVLIIVPSINLVSQLFSDYREYGWYDSYDDVSLLYGTSKNYDPNKKVLISTWQSIHKKGQKFFEQFDAVLVDECLAPKTQISMFDGTFKNIEDVCIGDKILSYNVDTKEFEKDLVVDTYENMVISSDVDMYEIEFNNGDIIQITGNHKLFTTNRGYVRADMLTCDDDVVFIENI